MAIGGFGGALLAGLEGYSQARKAEQQFATEEMRRQAIRQEMEQFALNQKAQTDAYNALLRYRRQQPLAGGGFTPGPAPGAGGMGSGGLPTGAFGGGDQGAGARTSDPGGFGQIPRVTLSPSSFDPLTGNPPLSLGNGGGTGTAPVGEIDPLTGNPLAGLNALNNGFSGSSRGGGPVPSAGAGGDDADVAPGDRARVAADALVRMGVRPDVAAGAVQYANRNESRLDPNAINPTSGAFGYNQWLGPRKDALLAQYGQRPSFGQQVAFTTSELQGPESATLDRLRRATTAKEGYNIWGQSFERPGSEALAMAGVTPGSPAYKGGQRALMQTVQNIPPMLLESPMMSMQGFARAIEEANPNAPPAEKAAAFFMGMKFLAPYEQERSRMMLELMKEEHQDIMQGRREEAATRREDIKDQERLRREGEEIVGEPFQVGDKFYARTKTGDVKELALPPGAKKVGTGEEHGWTTMEMTTPEGKVPVRVHAATGRVEPLQLPGGGTGLTRVGTPSQAGLPPATVSTMAEGIANYQLPPLSGWALRSPNGQAIMAEVMKINPQYDATTYGGKQAGARTVWNRAKQLDMAGNVVEEILPLALATSDRIDRTEYPTLNRMILAVEKGTGSEDVVRFLDQINSLKYAYGRALNPTGVPRIEDLRRFDDILSENWSKGQIRAALDQIHQTIQAERRGVAKSLGGGGTPSGGGGHKVGDIIEKGGKKYRITGGDPNDPDVEEVQ